MTEKYKTPRPEKKDDPNICSYHEKELGACCGVCRELVCIDCIVGDHRGHPIESVEDVYHKRKVRNKTLILNVCLQFISNQCALDVSIISRKPEVHPKLFSGKILLKNVTLQILIFIQVSQLKIFPRMV